MFKSPCARTLMGIALITAITDKLGKLLRLLLSIGSLSSDTASTTWSNDPASPLPARTALPAA